MLMINLHSAIWIIICNWFFCSSQGIIFYSGYIIVIKDLYAMNDKNLELDQGMNEYLYVKYSTESCVFHKLGKSAYFKKPNHV